MTLSDEQIDDLWLYRKFLHGGEILPQIRDFARALLAKQDGSGSDSVACMAPGVWHDGEPPHPWRTEWFIAETIHGDRVVLKALPKEYTYGYTTADGTYMMAKNIERWMQFPDSEFVAPRSAGNDSPITNQPSVPAGFVLVPVEPTPEMEQAARDSDRKYTDRNFGTNFPRQHQGAYDIWKAMISAAPAAPTPTAKQTPYGPAERMDVLMDAERLDWLERQDLNDIAVIRQTNAVVGINVGNGPPCYGKSLRAAIDAAMKEQP